MNLSTNLGAASQRQASVAGGRQRRIRKPAHPPVNCTHCWAAAPAGSETLGLPNADGQPTALNYNIKKRLVQYECYQAVTKSSIGMCCHLFDLFQRTL